MSLLSPFLARAFHSLRNPDFRTVSCAKSWSCFEDEVGSRCDPCKSSQVPDFPGMLPLPLEGRDRKLGYLLTMFVDIGLQRRTESH